MALNTHSLDLEAGSSQYASRADTASLSITGNLTLECWVKLESAPVNPTSFSLVSKWTTAGNQRSYDLFYFNAGGTYLLFFATSVNGTASNQPSIAYTLNLATWYHVAVVFTAASHTSEWFINGSSIGTKDAVSTSIKDSTAPFLIGKSTSTIYYYDGLIDEVRVWSVPRTEAQLDDNKDDHLIGNEAGLEGYWRLNNSDLDQTSNNNDLTLVASPVYSEVVPFEGEADAPTGIGTWKTLLGVGN